MLFDEDHERAQQDNPSSVPPSLFRAFRELAYQQAGIHLRDGKEALLATRIARRMQALGVAHPAEYLARLREDTSGEEMICFLDCISINLTSFYREPEHFGLLTGAALRCAAQGRRRMRVWCAAAASGEEAYSAAITLCEALAGTGVDHRVFATDISTRALSAAMAGRYTERQLGPVPDHLRAKYFVKLEAERGEHSAPLREVAPWLRERVLFARANLAAPPFPVLSPLDVILCRNVLIYFDLPVRQRVITELARLLRPGGLLMVGHAETLSGLRLPFTMVRPSVYRKPL
jgi:chemotaxis protein methyltransferase CheR